jgi:hypothetical protein
MDNYSKRTLKFYFKTVFEQSGMIWDRDNDAEIDQLVDELVGSKFDKKEKN